MEELIAFIQNHRNDSTNTLILKRNKWPEIDITTAVNTIDTYRRLRTKAPSWFSCDSLLFPYKLAAEQCSSEETALHKARLAARIHQLSQPDYTNTSEESKRKFKIADLTSGMGIDDWAFSQVADHVHYNDMNPDLVNAAQHNFAEIGVKNASFSNLRIEPGALTEDFDADIIFADPARRSSDGKKVFLIEDCAPDILGLTDEIFTHARHLLLKLSPMADITMACERLGDHCREVHIVGLKGECKELLIWMDRDWHGSYTIYVDEIVPSGCQVFSFEPSAETEATPDIVPAGAFPVMKEVPSEYNFDESLSGLLLFEPGKALMKSGAFKLICKEFGLQALSASTHLYIARRPKAGLSPEGEIFLDRLLCFGKVFEILTVFEYNKKNAVKAGKQCCIGCVTVKNLPIKSDTLRKTMKLSGASASDHFFACQTANLGNILIYTSRLYNESSRP